MYGSTKAEQEDMESLTTEYKVLRRLRQVDTRGDGTKIHVLSWNLSSRVLHRGKDLRTTYFILTLLFSLVI